MVTLPLAATAQQATKSDADLVREGPAALAAAHGDKPRYGGKFISAGNEVVPLFDMHQTSFGGVYAATAPAYNCLIRTSPYDPMALDIVPELADSWDISDGGKTVTFHLHKGVKWHDGMPFSSADVQYTIERIMNAIEDIAAELRGQYVLGYYSSGSGTGAIRVRMKNPDYRVHIRRDDRPR